MEKMKFKCTLLSDIILSQSSSTEGNQYSLDFIPGNNFLGIVAANIYNKVKEKALKIFHTGDVRFGDANPSIDGKRRGLKVPNAMFYPKLKKASEECYIHHLIPNPNNDAVKGLQLKQCRNGFYIFEQNAGTPIPADKNYAVKSAYDSKMRKSDDGKLFGYQSLPKGLELFFEIESDLDEATNKMIADVLKGIKHIGRSRTAQYGLVQIEDADYNEVPSNKLNGKKFATVYADGRLIFLDEYGEPTFRPTAKDLGFKETDKIDWTKSQIRTFLYSPWNGKRHTYDTDRCGIEKGSVFVIECSESPSESTYIGFYNNEGFGKVIYNPEFLDGNEEGKANYILKDIELEAKKLKMEVSEETPLLRYLNKQRQLSSYIQSAYQDVNEFVKNNADRFTGERFASQWSSIRNIAMIEPDETKIKTAIMNFLGHGVAEAKWNEKGRKKVLEDFMEKNKENIRDRIINLASEMSKQGRKEGRKS